MTKANKAIIAVTGIPPAGKVLPYDRFEPDKWNTMDADVRFKGQRIERGSTLPISDLSTHIILQNAELKLQPLTVGLAGGTISSNIRLEGDKKPMQGRAEIQVRRRMSTRCRIRKRCRTGGSNDRTRSPDKAFTPHPG